MSSDNNEFDEFSLLKEFNLGLYIAIPPP